MNESNFLGVSVRGWIAVVLVLTTCAMSMLMRDIKEPLYSLVVLAVGFFFGQKTPPSANGSGSPA